MLAIFYLGACAGHKFYYSGDLPLDQSLLQEKFSADEKSCEDHATEKAELYGGHPDDRWIKNSVFFPIPCVSCNPEKFEEILHQCMREKNWEVENPSTPRKHLFFNRW